MALPGLTREQMIEVDRIMMENLNIPIELMMEHAGLALARLASDLTGDKTKIIHVVVGSGNNGGGGLVAARRLKAWNQDVMVLIPRGIESLRPIPRKQLERILGMGISVSEKLPDALSSDITVLDAYLGYGYSERQDPITDDVFEFLSNNHSVLSLDVPSGLDSNTGQCVSAFKPQATLTIAFPKVGLLFADKSQIGDLYVCDIGVPISVFETQLGIKWSNLYSLDVLSNLYLEFELSQIVKAIPVYHDEKRKIGWAPRHYRNQ